MRHESNLPPDRQDVPMAQAMDITRTLLSALIKNPHIRGGVPACPPSIIVLEASADFTEADDLEYRELKARSKAIPPDLADRRRGFRIIKAWESTLGIPAGLDLQSIISNASPAAAAAIVIHETRLADGDRRIVADLHHHSGSRLAAISRYNSGITPAICTPAVWCTQDTIPDILPPRHAWS